MAEEMELQSQTEEGPRPQGKKRPQRQIKKEPQPQEEPQEEPLERFTPPLPTNGGWWAVPNAQGNCDWMFDLISQRPNIYTNNGYTSWWNLLQNSVYPRADRVNFQQDYPDFSPYLIKVYNTQNPLSVDADFTFPAGLSLTLNRAWNFRQADGWVAQAVRSTAGNVAYLRRDEKLTWHELESCDQMILVPRVIHGNVPHGGGIGVLKSGGIGSVDAEAAAPQMEYRMLGGMDALRGRGICRIRYPLSRKGGISNTDCFFYCDDDGGEPTQAQLQRMELLGQNWPKVEQAAWAKIQDYVDHEYGEGGESAELAVIVIFPASTLTGEIDIGLYYENFPGDLEHGLGARILGDQNDLMIVGSGDIAL